ncbi:MAG TPA: M55 family metallopeptidase [Thermomicrobiaceae bacterium]|nr:M55 family metallopeptidase [Thermomicrobiaceae bacterium]
MRIVISADMEGTAGVVNWVHVTPPDQANPPGSSAAEYGWARLAMTREVNAAIEGALSAGADEVIVNDSHDGMRNLLPEELHLDALSISGFEKPLSMVQGVDEPDVTGLIFTGYHAKAGTPNGVLAHSFTLSVDDIRLNGVSVGEYGINAAIAGHFGVPVIMVAGDELAVRQAQELLGEQIVGVVLKRGLGTSAAIGVTPAKARIMIREGAREAVSRLAEYRPYNPGWPCRVEIAVNHQERIDRVMALPGAERTGNRSFATTVNDGLELAALINGALGLMR